MILDDEIIKELKNSLHGLEKEALRVTDKGHLSLTKHPFGSKLTDPYLTTDFAEAQLEMISPPFHQLCDVKQFMIQFQKDLLSRMTDLMWPYSAPCILPKDSDILIADFGKSAQGRLKKMYREGLALRYGKKMQMLSGIHYNFSFSDGFFKKLQKHSTHDSMSFRDFKDALYFKLIRNFFKNGWICSYLFGVSPCVDQTYLDDKHSFEKWKQRTYTLPFATSIRMSKYGYYNRIYSQIAISFNSIQEYLHGLKKALTTEDPQYKKLKGKQLNSYIFQIEAEHYTRIRPKRVLREKKTPLEALKKHGVEYLEIRSLDISPFCFSGIELEHLYFLHVFLLYCLFSQDQKITKKQRCELYQNQNNVALLGRMKNLKLQRDQKSIFLKDWAFELLEEMKPFAKHLDKAHQTKRYSQSLLVQKKKVQDPDQTPSAQLLNILKEKNLDLVEYILNKAKEHFNGGVS